MRDETISLAARLMVVSSI